MTSSNRFELMETLNKYYFMFCTELLMTNSLLSNIDGTPMGLHKFVTYFAYHEPSNLVMAHILARSGQEVDDDESWNDELFEKDMIVLLSRLFNHVSIYDEVGTRKERLLNTWNSRVILDDEVTNEAFKRALDEFNRNTDVIFKKNLKEQTERLNHEFDYLLPFSKYQFAKSSDSSSEQGMNE